MGNLLLAILANVLSILIEYRIIKPKFETAWNPLLSQSGNRDWSTAVKKSIQKLRSTQGGHVLPFGENYRVEDVHIEKGKGTVSLVVLPKTALVYAFTGLSLLVDALKVDEFPHVIARYQIVIDRSGDILNIKSIPVAENEKYRPLYSTESRIPRFARPRRTSTIPGVFGTSQDGNIIPNGLILKEIKKPIKTVTSNGLMIEIEFSVENWGEATTVYPYVRYKIAEYKNGKFEEKIVVSPTDWKVELKAFSSKPFTFVNTLPFGTQLLAKGKDSVHVKLYRKPWASTN